jgi:hypothetical protein
MIFWDQFPHGGRRHGYLGLGMVFFDKSYNLRWIDCCQVEKGFVFNSGLFDKIDNDTGIFPTGVGNVISFRRFMVPNLLYGIGDFVVDAEKRVFD